MNDFVPKSRPRRRATHGRGFALVLTLMVLVLAAVALGSVGRLSLGQALQARAAHEDLQWRWGVRSCRETVLARAEPILAAAEASSLEPVRTLRAKLTLGDQAFELALSDEQAKVNLNTLYQRGGAERARRAAWGLSTAGRTRVDVRLTPIEPSAIDRATPNGRAAAQLPALGSLAQVFGVTPPEALVGEGAIYPLADLTCWGDGKLNFRRASPAALNETLSGALETSKGEDLVSLRRQNPGLSAAKGMALLEIPAAQIAAAESLLTDGSRCQSLWVLGRPTGSTMNQAGPPPPPPGELRGSAARCVLLVRDASVRGTVPGSGGTDALVHVFEW